MKNGGSDRSDRPGRRFLHVLKYVIIWGWAFVSVAPVVVIFLDSLKTVNQIVTGPPLLLFWPTAQNYVTFIFTNFANAIIGGVHYLPELLGSSLIVTLGGALLAVVVGVVASFSLSTFKMPGKRTIMALVLAVLMIPESAFAIGLLFYTRDIGLYDTYLGIILFDAALAVPFTIWITRAFFDSLPRGGYEASLLDGCSPLRALYKVVLPQAREGIVVAFFFAFITVWGEFLVGETITANGVITAMSYVDAFDTFVGSLPYGYLAALFTIYTAIPFVIAYFMRGHLVKGLTVGTIREEIKDDTRRAS